MRERQKLLTVGRMFFGLALLAIGLQEMLFAFHLIAARPGSPVPAMGDPVAMVLYAALLLCGVGLLGLPRVGVRYAGYLAAFVLFFQGVVHYLPGLVAHPHDPNFWTPFAELVGLGGAALVLAGEVKTPAWHLGRVLFAGSLVVFGVQHVLYAKFVGTLIPVWIPNHLFWAQGVGVAFFLVAAVIVGSTVEGRLRPLAGLANGLLGLMFFLWLPMLHGPRIASALGNGDEWVSGLVCLAFAGAAWILAGR